MYDAMDTGIGTGNVSGLHSVYPVLTLGGGWMCCVVSFIAWRCLLFSCTYL